MSYAFLDGLRGFGALAVYFSHFIATFYPYFLYGKPKDYETNPKWHEPPTWLMVVNNTPLHIITNGPFWVTIFFILSGFVLTLRWFKTRKQQSIYGAVFRRYFRLMLPLLAIIMIYYLVAKLDATKDPGTLKKVKLKYYWEVIFDGLLGTWFGVRDYTYVTWTLTIELWASYFCFFLAETVVWYRYRYWLYIAVFATLYTGRLLDDFNLTHYGFTGKENNSMVDVNLRAYLPLFTLGVIFSDVENLKLPKGELVPFE